MKSELSSRDRDLVQRFLDGVTTAEEAAQCEERIRNDESFRRVYTELVRLRDLLSGAEKLDTDPAFYGRFAGRLHHREEDERRNLLPFPQKYLPLAASGFALLVLLSFSYVFENRLSFLRFWETHSEVVRTVYEKSVEEGSFIPLFSGLDNDKTLQFALYGSLPLDETGGAMLNVDERSAEGYRIEVQKEQPRKQKKVSVADFIAEVRPTTVQKAAIESLLSDARRELEGAVLVGQNEAVAINADLSKLNRAMASGIVAVLEPDQRERLKRLLTQEDAAYAYSSRSRIAPQPELTSPASEMPRTKNRFVVLTPDSVRIQALHVNIEQIHQELMQSESRFREVQAMREKTIQWLMNDPFVQRAEPVTVPTAIAPGISLRTRKDRLTIHIQDTAGARIFIAPDGGSVFVQGADSMARFEFQVRTSVPSPGGAVVVSPLPPTIPKPDSAKPRKPFKLDIN